MTTSTTHDRQADDPMCDDSASVWPALLAAGGALFLGYFAGRVSFANDLREAVRRSRESPEPVEISIRTL
jgi:hypothetical protein